MIKNPPAIAGDLRNVGSIPGSGRSPGGGHGNPLQYSCLENPMDKGAWWATVHPVTKSQTRLKRLSAHTYHIFFIHPAIDGHLSSFYILAFVNNAEIKWECKCLFKILTGLISLVIYPEMGLLNHVLFLTF